MDFSSFSPSTSSTPRPTTFPARPSIGTNSKPTASHGWLEASRQRGIFRGNTSRVAPIPHSQEQLTLMQLTRSLCRELCVVLKKALGRLKPDLRVIAGPDGLKVQGRGHQHAVEYYDPQPRDPAELMMPFALLEDVQGTKDEPVRLCCTKSNVLTATWQDRGVERTMQYTLPKDNGTRFHDQPTTWASNPPTLLRALHDASQCTDPFSSRYALGCMQLQGAFGRLAATDGKQLLLQSGYSFGFQDEVLAHSSDVFGCAELPQDQVVQIGKTETHLVVRVDPWSFYLAVGDGRFPRVSDIIPSFQSAKTTVDLHPADAQFLVANMTRLPGNVGQQDVTLDLNGTVAIRAKTDDSQPAEIVLQNSNKSGDSTAVCLNRLNLLRAARMGFENLYLFGNASALLARDDS